MSTNKPVRTITATCACGASFSREVKRGRPQVWCPSCVTVPFYERTAASTTPVQVDATQWTNCATCGVPHNSFQNCPEVTPERIVNEHDDLDLVRADIDAGMVAINADHKSHFARLLALGLPVMDAADKAQAVTLTATQNLYALHAPSKYKPGREITE